MRLIDADKLPVVTEWCVDEAGFGASFRVVHEEDINKAPTIDFESLRPQGGWNECDWVEYDGHGECIHHPKAGLRCSNCCNAFKKELLWKDNYCPNCGAKMKGAGENA